MEIKLVDASYNKSNYDLTLKSNHIIGITGKNKEILMNILDLNINYKGNIFINGTKVDKDNINKYRKKISLIEKELKINTTVKEYMEYIIKYKRLEIKDENKKMIDSLRIVGLNKTYLDRYYNTLSNSEKKLIAISIGLLSNPDILIFDDIFIGLDNKYQKKLHRLFTKLKDQYNKLIIIFSNNSNILYKYTDKIVFLYDNEVLIEGKTNSLYTKVDYLKEYKFDIPDIVLFTYKARKKGIKLGYHKDIRDIIKDIYKHV
ncbi:MAG: ATP-binding cassette domain-containing protein [Bacilli bacterium]|nr:ATP-binding cassette domain-containing protein [Bacilli bacterium]MBR3049782.1 ATP-binding cassette domain-containing protein [Bacilli bacterium]